MIPYNALKALNGNDTSHCQPMAKPYEITKLLKNVKFTLKYSDHVMYKLLLMVEPKYHDI